MNPKLRQRIEGLARRETAAVLRRLPGALRGPASALPVSYESRPSSALAEELGGDDLLGLFVGMPYGMSEVSDPLPAQILLFLENIWDYAGEDESVYCEEVALTFLHELGHYLGLDEEDVEERGL
ncbi:MAG: metallopeptidase family protein [Opitutaceae bacterium]